MSGQRHDGILGTVSSPIERFASGRGRGRPPIPRDRLVRTALELVDEQGAEALTLRSLAAKLNSSTATLYRHFSSRDDLARHVADEIFAEVAVDEGRLAAQPWDRTLADVAEQLFTALVRHENAAALMLERAPAGPNALRVRVSCISALLADGFSRADAVRTYATFARFVLGFGIQLRSETGEPAAPRQDAVDSVPLADEFAYGLRLMLTGLRADRTASS